MSLHRVANTGDPKRDWVDDGPRHVDANSVTFLYTTMISAASVAAARDVEELSTYGMGRDSMAAHAAANAGEGRE